MKKISAIVLLFLGFVSLVACHRYEFTDQNGQVVNLKNHPNKWLILNYWAPWCEPCKHELPEINHFYLVNRTRADVYGVDYDHPAPQQLKALAQKMGLDYPLLVQDPGKYLHLGNIQGLPVTFIFNPQGQLVKTLVGPQTRSSLEAVITTGK